MSAVALYADAYVEELETLVHRHAPLVKRIAYHLMLGINCLLTTLAGVVAYLVARRLIELVPSKPRTSVRGRR